MSPADGLKDELDGEHVYFGGAYDALAPAGISFIGPNGSVLIGNAELGAFETARNYLYYKFGVTVVHVSGRWLVLGCEPTVPSYRMPGTAGGFLAIWRPASDMSFNPLIGRAGGKYIDVEEEDEVNIDGAIIAAFEQYAIPTKDAIVSLASVFPDCNAITFVIDTIIIEYPATDEQSFRRRLQTLPDYIPGAPFHIRYHNGPLPNTPQRRRLRRPQPELDEEDENRVEDNTNYVARDGKFYPGSMISSTARNSTTYTSVTAGVLVFKGDEKKFTCSWHNWEEHEDQYPGLLGTNDDEARRMFTVLQGEPGSKVGHVVRRVANTDIALAKLDEEVVFENTFMDIRASAKRLVHSDSVHVGDEYVVDGFPIGKRILPGLGARFELKRGPIHPTLVPPNNDQSSLPPAGTYVAVVQGVCAATDELNTSQPTIHGRTCGAVLVRSRDASNPSLNRTQMLARGEICGFFHYANLTPKHASEALYYLAYTEVFDPLIDEGWQIVPVPGEQVYDNVRKYPPGGPVDSPTTPALSTPRRAGLRPRSEASSSASRG
ncbi:hypothetical protein OQA88_10828 [Cercophora sp. LCS_1]